MKNSELFHKTVVILVKAYQNDTLEHGDCTACAVGNLVCANMFNNDFDKWYESYDKNMHKCSNWNNAFMTSCLRQDFDKSALNEENIQNQIASTGYDYLELAKIEFAFETAPNGANSPNLHCDSKDEKWMFNGLMSVVDTLMKIHESTPEEATAAKDLFVKV